MPTPVPTHAVIALSRLDAQDAGFWRLQPIAQQLLSDAERLEFGRVRSASARGRRIACRAWLRLLLGEALGRPPDAIRFERTAHGRLELAGGPHGVFNVSQTDGAIAVAVLQPPWRGSSWRIGVDVETPSRQWTPDLAAALFPPDELDWLDGLPPERRDAGFLVLWTLREAVLKADGRGLSLDLRQIRFRPLPVDVPPLPQDGLHVAIEESAAIQPARWCCWVRQDGAATCALAVQANGRCGRLSVELERVDERSAVARMRAALNGCTRISA